MVRIRLSRTGAKKQPSYRIVVADSEAKRDGRYIERIGHYNPRTEPLEYLLDEERALYWLSVGAKPSDAVQRLLEKQGTSDRLIRLRKGESMDVLIAEYSGQDLSEIAASEMPSELSEEVLAEAEELVAAIEEEE
jgi:small subunit ribosomal protein S16